MPDPPPRDDPPSGAIPPDASTTRRRGASKRAQAATTTAPPGWHPEQPESWTGPGGNGHGAPSPAHPSVRLRRTRDHQRQFKGSGRRWRIFHRKERHPIRRSISGALFVLVLGLGLIVWHAYTEAYHEYQAVSTVVPNLTSARQELSQGLLPENDPIGDALATATQVQSEVDHPSWMVRITASLPVLKQPILAVRAGVKAALEESLGAHDLQSVAT